VIDTSTGQYRVLAPSPDGARILAARLSGAVHAFAVLDIR
jgi:hypothetical protein